MPYDDLIEKHALRVGLDPNWVKRIIKIESNFRAYETTGSYKGLTQLNNAEFKRHGGTGSIYDPEQNIMAGVNKLAQDKLEFKAKHNRDPSLGDLYMVHQQGEGGSAAHAANPDGLAWKNMYSTKEGRDKGIEWSKRAIWGNIPDNLKGKFGSVENVKSSDLVGIYNEKLEGRGEVSGREWKTHQKAIKEGTDTELMGRAETQGEPKPKKEPEDTGPGFQPTGVTHVDVESPTIGMGRAVVAPILQKAGRVPQ